MPEVIEFVFQIAFLDTTIYNCIFNTGFYQLILIGDFEDFLFICISFFPDYGTHCINDVTHVIWCEITIMETHSFISLQWKMLCQR